MIRSSVVALIAAVSIGTLYSAPDAFARGGGGNGRVRNPARARRSATTRSAARRATMTQSVTRMRAATLPTTTTSITPLITGT